MTKIKFRFHNKPLSDEQIASHQNFDSLLTAFAAAPQPSLQYRLIHNRFFIYTTGIMSGIIITTIATLFIFKTETTQLTQTQNATSSQNNSEVVVSNSSNKNSSPEKISTGDNDEEKKSYSGRTLNAGFSSSNPAKTFRNSSSTVVVESDNLIMDEGHVELVSSDSPRQTFDWKPSEEIVQGVDEKSIQLIPQPEIVPYQDMEGPVVQLTYDTSMLKFKWDGAEELVKYTDEYLKQLNDESSNTNSPISQSPNYQLEDTSKKKLSDVTAKVGDEVVELSKNITDESKDSYLWMRTKLNGVFASRYHDKRQTAHDTVTIQNRAAQVSFLYPIGSNGITSGKFSNVFSFNILSGYNGGVNGFELGGLVNIDRKNMNGLQIGGLTNVVFGNANGLQIGGLVNHARSVNGAQIGGLVNTSLGFVEGTQIGGIVNYALDSIDGAQIGGIANISTTSHSINGVQIGGIANLSLGKMNGSQISGIINVANRINGMQISLINVGVKVSGMQIGLINISDSLSGVPIGLISISRTGMFHLDLFSNDFSYANTCLRLGSDKFYNTFAIGVTPNTSYGNRYSFGYGIGTHIDISKKIFMNIDALAWDIHYRSFIEWRGINMVNQLRILPGWQITKGIGLYAGPCVNVEVIDDSFNSSVKTHLFSEHGGGTTGVNGWIGWTAGLQFF